MSVGTGICGLVLAVVSRSGLLWVRQPVPRWPVEDQVENRNLFNELTHIHNRAN